MKKTVGDVLADVTQDQVEMMQRLSLAIQATAAIVLPDPKWAAAALFGGSVALLIEHHGADERAVHDMVTHWFANNGSIRAQIARLSIRAVKAPPDGPKGPE